MNDNAPQKFRKKPVEVTALQWDGGDQRAEELYEFTTREGERFGCTVHITQFMVLGEDDSYEVFNAYDEDGEIAPNNEVDRRIAEGYSAVVYDDLNDTWVSVATGDWIIRGVQGEFYPCKPDIFAETYEAVPA
ncbi:hypothetical protein FDI84_gp56 [Mycobacterium phage Pipsqueaks]|uniref:Uncharacterized protein n=2 Tax=Charlievirus Pipsqueaks TaxID=2169810 RepID=A0A142K7X6_9CAUD|nr:hypothetical protein FDI84_gp56 [Mycobacterium phage Pipsqueaks]AMS02209.1 hypothetical protein SEA_PIPSQUEAKS_56 [Mycobacterium phage Pipsqueaks]AXQ52625.1 hypothetical protein SEA_GEX_56 [Mycobacterium phage Gex]